MKHGDFDWKKIAKAAKKGLKKSLRGKIPSSYIGFGKNAVWPQLRYSEV